MSILDKYTLNIAKLPEYPHFKGKTKFQLDEKLCGLILSHGSLIEDGNERITEPMKSLFKDKICDKINEKGILVSTYKNRHGIGRVYPDDDCNLTVHSKYIKNTIFSYMGCVDLDFAKSHPSIAYSVSVLNGDTSKVANIKTYLDNPQKAFDEIKKWYGNGVNDSDAKEVFNIILYGGSVKTWLGEMAKDKPLRGKVGKKIPNLVPTPKCIVNFESDVKTLTSTVLKANPELLKCVSRTGDKDWENQNRVLSYWLGAIENDMLHCMVDFLVEHKIIRAKKNVEYAYDGATFIPRKNVDYDVIIPQIETLIKSKTGIDIKVKSKEFKPTLILQDIIKMRDAIVEPMCEEIVGEVVREKPKGVFSDLDATRKIYDLYPHFVFCEGVQYTYDESNGMWNTGKDGIYKVLGKYADELHTMVVDGKGYKRSPVKSYGNTRSLMDEVVKLLPMVCKNDDWMKSKRDSGLGCLLFQNGIYYGKTGEFKYEFNPNLVFMCRVEQDFVPLDEDIMEYAKDIKARLFCKVLGDEMGDYLLLKYSRGLMGDMMKNMLFGIGEANSGKSVLSKALASACGTCVGTFNGENLALNKSSADEAQQMRWAMLLSFKRIIISNEMKSKDTVLNGNQIKKLASGGDSLTGRGHCQNECSFTCHFLVMVYANDMQKIEPLDKAVKNRIEGHIFNYTKAFVDKPKNEYELQADYNIENEIKTDRFKLAMIWLLLERYRDFKRYGEIRPDCMAESTGAWVDITMCPVTLFLEIFEITNDEADFVTSTMVEECVKRPILETLNMGYRKFALDLKKHCAIKRYDEVVNKSKKVGGRVVQVWTGIKLIVDTEECDCESETDGESEMS